MTRMCWRVLPAGRNEHAGLQRPRPGERRRPRLLDDLALGCPADGDEAEPAVDDRCLVGTACLHDHEWLVRASADERFRIREAKRTCKPPLPCPDRILQITDRLPMTGWSTEQEHAPPRELPVPHDAGIAHDLGADALRAAGEHEAAAFPSSRDVKHGASVHDASTVYRAPRRGTTIIAPPARPSDSLTLRTTRRGPREGSYRQLSAS